MPKPFLPERPFFFGEKKLMTIASADVEGADLSAATATIKVSSAQTGTTILSATAMTATGTSPRTFSYLLTTGTAMNITLAGLYLVEYTITFGTSVYIERQYVLVTA